MAEINIESPLKANLDVNKLVEMVHGMPSGSRSGFTNGVVNHFVALGYNVFVCHPDHRVDGPYAKVHYEVRNTMFSTIGFDVYIMARGHRVVATNLSDGGFDNWAVGGTFDKNDKTVTFY